MWKRVNVQQLLARLMMAGGLILLSGGAAWAAGTAEPAVVKLTDQDRIYLILSCLTDAINNPNQFNLDMLSPVLPSEKESICQRIAGLLQTTQRSQKSTHAELDYELKFELQSVSETAKGYSAAINTILYVNGIPRQRAITIDLDRNGLCPKIKNVSGFLDSLEGFIIQARNELEPLAALKKHEESKAAMAITSYQSDHMLIPKNIYGNIARLSAQVSREITVDSNHIFSQPYGVSAILYEAEGQYWDHDFLVVSDANWDRITGTADNPIDPDWILAFGSNGSGNFNFRQPMGIDFLGYSWVVADAYNNRAQVYTLDYYGTVEFVFSLTGDFDFVSDVAAAWIPSLSGDPLYDRFEIAVLDQGNSRVKIFDGNGNYLKTMFQEGSGFQQLRSPTSVCYGRNSITNYPIDYLYVADNGNNRVVNMSTSSPYWFVRTPDGIFPEDADLTSVDVDAFGHVYVVDRHNSTIYLLSRDLQELIATFGTTGTADNQLLYPNCFTVAKGWLETSLTSWEPIILGDAVVTEQFGQQTGVRRYVLGCDVLSHELSYSPQPIEGAWDYVVCKWHQSGTSESWRSVYCNGNLKNSTYNSLNVAGSQSYVYWLDSADVDGFYKFAIRVKSYYPNSTDTTFIDSLWVHRYVDSSWNQPRIIIEDFGIYDPEGMLPDSCIYLDTTRWWNAWIHAYDYQYDTTVLWYLWRRCDQYEDVWFKVTPDDQPQYYLVTTASTVMVQFIDHPFTNPTFDSSCLINVQIQDADGNGFNPCKSPETEMCYHTARFWYPLYTNLSQTPCAYSGCCIGIRGNANGDPDDLVNIADQTYLVAYLKSMGPEPPCFEEADVNGSGIISIPDVTYLMAYLKSIGPAPPACP
jgi:hypothetical protein